MPDYTFDLFLSHNTKDKPEVVRLNALLLQRGLNGWLDKEQLPPGQNWQRLIEDGLKNSRAIAACFGPAGIGPWHDEEMQAAMNLAVRQGRPVIPVLLPGSATEPELPLFLQNRGWVDFRNGFADEAIEILVWGITGTRRDKEGVRSAPGTPPVAPTPDPAEYERKVRDAFGAQYDQLKGILEKYPQLREALAGRYSVAGESAAQLTARLIASFHANFCGSIAEFSLLYEEEGIEPGVLLELVSTVLYLSMCPDYARGLLADKEPMRFEVPATAKQGIAEMLLTWTRGKGQKPVPIKHLSNEKPPELFETPPQMTVTTMKHSLMDRLGISRDDDAGLAKALNWRKDRHRPEYQAVEAKSEADKLVIEELQSPNSPLCDLLLLIKSESHTINPMKRSQNKRYEDQLEYDLNELMRILRTP